jgi:hypothetical protein
MLMCLSAYLVVSGIIFGLVAVLHLVRLVRKMPVQLGGWAFPMRLSWGGLVVAAILCAWAFSLLCQCHK